MRWVQSPSHPLLMVSDWGQVRYSPTGRQHGGTDGGKAGYKQFRYVRDGVEFRPYVHRLVCEAFHGPAPSPDAMALHKGDIRSDNSAANLRWGTNSENMVEAFSIKRPRKPKRAPSIAYIHGHMAAGMSRAAIARKWGCDPYTITRALRRHA